MQKKSSNIWSARTNILYTKTVTIDYSPKRNAFSESKALLLTFSFFKPFTTVTNYESLVSEILEKRKGEGVGYRIPCGENMSKKHLSLKKNQSLSLNIWPQSLLVLDTANKSLKCNIRCQKLCKWMY